MTPATLKAMSALLNARTTVITGGASGIGRAAAKRFAAEGARVAILDITEGAGKAVVDEIVADGHEAMFITTDVTDEGQVYEAFGRVSDAFGPVDVLYNCAGGSTSKDGRVDQLSVETVDEVLKLELLSVILCSRAAIPRMAESGGAIINMSSFVAFRGAFDVHAYSAAKGALVSLTRTMAGSYADRGIRVNAIAPGAALSVRTEKRLTDPNITDGALFKFTDYPFAIGTPEEIANIATFLASDQSRLINAQTIVADGGISAY